MARRGETEVTVCVSANPFAGEVFWTDGNTAYRRHSGTDQLLIPSAASNLVDANLDPTVTNKASRLDGDCKNNGVTPAKGTPR